MFEKEVNTILEKEKNTIELINKLNEIYKPYDYNGAKKNDIFYRFMSSIYFFSCLELLPKIIFNWLSISTIPLAPSF